jgi:hypothetical protein
MGFDKEDFDSLEWSDVNEVSNVFSIQIKFSDGAIFNTTGHLDSDKRIVVHSSAEPPIAIGDIDE